MSQADVFVPPKKKITLELVVGLFLLIGCVCFGYLAINIGGIKMLAGDTYKVTATFDNISGLEMGASVELAGVHIGQVSNITLDDTSALVEMAIERGATLRDDDILAVRTKGIIGDRYLKVIPGGSEELVGDGGSVFDTESVVELEDVIGKFIHSLDDKE